MSQHSPSAAPQSYGVSSNSPISPELSERIRKLHEAAQDVAAFYAQAGQGNDGDLCPRPKPTGETRCYYLAAATVQHKRELLRKYNGRVKGRHDPVDLYVRPLDWECWQDFEAARNLYVKGLFNEAGEMFKSIGAIMWEKRCRALQKQPSTSWNAVWNHHPK